MLNTFDVIPKRKRITLFKLGKLWVFKQFFDNKALFRALLEYYNKDQYRCELKSIGARNNALKLLERNGFDYDLVEDLKGYVVQLPKHAKYAQILMNSVAFRETANERIASSPGVGSKLMKSGQMIKDPKVCPEFVRKSHPPHMGIVQDHMF